jgi:hypothetical protein
MKICKDCGLPLPLDMFYESVSGHFNDCKTCFREKRNKRHADEVRQRIAQNSALQLAEIREDREPETTWIRPEPEIEVERVEPRSFAGVVDRFFRSQRKQFHWRIA